MNSVALIGLCKIELPGSYGNVLLCDGGFIEFDSETYASFDALLGTIGSIESVAEGVGNEIPMLDMVLLPPEDTSPGELAQPGWQTARARFWIGEYDPEAGTLIGDPDLVFDGQLDQAVLSAGATREVALSIVSLAERLFERNTGNGLTSAWHKSIWPGELGHDNATGLNKQIAWGAAAPPTAGGSYIPGTPFKAPGGFRDSPLVGE